jgi:hypothetical protein
MYSKGPLSSKTSTTSSIFDDFLGFRAHLQVFECFCKFSSHDFTVPQISAAQINATARTNEGLWKSQGQMCYLLEREYLMFLILVLQAICGYIFWQKNRYFQ